MEKPYVPNPTRYESATFRRCGRSGFFTTWKAVYVDYSDKLQRAQIDNAE